ncbi:hypothetical protein C0995_007930 [Termitomyces sp. Mi166|nr:hypothetical protein C0995_007930 [Termitomyces sp. Mi166\
MTMTTPGPSHTPVNRPQDDPMSLMGYPNPQFPHNTPRIPPASSAQFSSPFMPSSTPPIAMPDLAQPGLATPGSTGNPRANFHLTPAQQYEQMNNTSPGSFTAFDMPPPSTVVGPRPPSRLNPNPHTPAPNSHPNPQITHHSPHTHAHSHASDPLMGGGPGPGPGTAGAHPQRPQSQPQRPSSQQAHAHTLGTPRSMHTALPPGPQMHPVRPGTGMAPPMASQPAPAAGPGPGAGPGQHAMQIVQRPPAQGVGVAPMPAQQPANAPASSAPSDTPPSNAAVIPRQQPPPPPVFGQGQGLIRLLQFSASLAAENKKDQKVQLSWWNDLIDEYFTPKAIMKFTLWKDNQRNEAKPFEIGVPILPRFFLVTTQSGVKSMTLSLDGARERTYTHGHSMVECINAVWTYKYHNGYTVTLRGPLTAHIVVTTTLPPGSAPSPPSSSVQAQNQQPSASNLVLKFEEFQFDANMHDKYISLDSIQGTRSIIINSPPMLGIRNATPLGSGPSGPAGLMRQQQQQIEEDNKRWEEPRVTIEMASIPGEPVNAFGIPQATMRCLELAESVSAMADLISFSREQHLGPLEALNRFAATLRQMQPFNPPSAGLPPPLMMNGPSNNPFTPMQSTIPPTSATTLYSSAPPSVTNPSGVHTHTTNLVHHAPTPTGTGSTTSPKNANAPPSANNSPQKQHKTIPQQTPGASSSSTSAPAASPAVSSGGTTNTPAMSNASLKRKQGSEAASPTNVVEVQPPPKRQMRRRRTTGAANSGAGG